MVIVGLTGSIGMGKTTAAGMLRRLGVAVHDADAAVHQVMAPGGAAVARIGDLFDGVIKTDGSVDRQALGAQVFGDDEALAELEAILHPLVRRAEGQFLRQCARRRARVVVLDVPLLFETGGQARCDVVVVVSASRRVQRQRVMRRAAMTAEKFQAILDRQMDDGEKRRRADYVVETGLGLNNTLRQLRDIVKTVRLSPARHWPPGPQKRIFHA